MTPEQIARISALRDKARTGALTLEETREAIALMRQDRVTASVTSAKSRTSKAKAKAEVNSDDLLSQLEGI